jgi:D-alanine-D-alanine ligase
LVERWLGGAEYTVGILEKEMLPVVEIRPVGGLFDYEHKYTRGGAAELCPAPISAEKTALLQTFALRAFRALDLRDVARIDFKEDERGVPCFLEANTLPGMTPTSLMPQEAAAVGIDYDSLCEKLILMAYNKGSK